MKKVTEEETVTTVEEGADLNDLRDAVNQLIARCPHAQ